MINDIEPIVGNWYFHLGKGQKFTVNAVSEEQGLVEVQHFDGDLEEMTFDDWGDTPMLLSEEPLNWTGSFDISEVDDISTGITDTSTEDWQDALNEFKRP